MADIKVLNEKEDVSAVKAQGQMVKETDVPIMKTEPESTPIPFSLFLTPEEQGLTAKDVEDNEYLSMHTEQVNAHSMFLQGELEFKRLQEEDIRRTIETGNLDQPSEQLGGELAEAGLQSSHKAQGVTKFDVKGRPSGVPAEVSTLGVLKDTAASIATSVSHVGMKRVKDVVGIFYDVANTIEKNNVGILAPILRELKVADAAKYVEHLARIQAERFKPKTGGEQAVAFVTEIASLIYLGSKAWESVARGAPWTAVQELLRSAWGKAFGVSGIIAYSLDPEDPNFADFLVKSSPDLADTVLAALASSEEDTRWEKRLKNLVIDMGMSAGMEIGIKGMSIGKEYFQNTPLGMYTTHKILVPCIRFLKKVGEIKLFHNEEALKKYMEEAEALAKAAEKASKRGKRSPIDFDGTPEQEAFLYELRRHMEDMLDIDIAEASKVSGLTPDQQAALEGMERILKELPLKKPKDALKEFLAWQQNLPVTVRSKKASEASIKMLKGIKEGFVVPKRLLLTDTHLSKRGDPAQELLVYLRQQMQLPVPTDIPVVSLDDAIFSYLKHRRVLPDSITNIQEAVAYLKTDVTAVTEQFKGFIASIAPVSYDEWLNLNGLFDTPTTRDMYNRLTEVYLSMPSRNTAATLKASDIQKQADLIAREGSDDTINALIQQAAEAQEAGDAEAWYKALIEAHERIKVIAEKQVRERTFKESAEGFKEIQQARQDIIDMNRNFNGTYTSQHPKHVYLSKEDALNDLNIAEGAGRDIRDYWIVNFTKNTVNNQPLPKFPITIPQTGEDLTIQGLHMAFALDPPIPPLFQEIIDASEIDENLLNKAIKEYSEGAVKPKVFPSNPPRGDASFIMGTQDASKMVYATKKKASRHPPMLGITGGIAGLFGLGNTDEDETNWVALGLGAMAIGALLYYAPSMYHKMTISSMKKQAYRTVSEALGKDAVELAMALKSTKSPAERERITKSLIAALNAKASVEGKDFAGLIGASPDLTEAAKRATKEIEAMRANKVPHINATMSIEQQEKVAKQYIQESIDKLGDADAITVRALSDLRKISDPKVNGKRHASTPREETSKHAQAFLHEEFHKKGATTASKKMAVEGEIIDEAVANIEYATTHFNAAVEIIAKMKDRLSKHVSTLMDEALYPNDSEARHSLIQKLLKESMALLGYTEKLGGATTRMGQSTDFTAFIPDMSKYDLLGLVPRLTGRNSKKELEKLAIMLAGSTTPEKVMTTLNVFTQAAGNSYILYKYFSYLSRPVTQSKNLLGLATKTAYYSAALKLSSLFNKQTAYEWDAYYNGLMSGIGDAWGHLIGKNTSSHVLNAKKAFMENCSITLPFNHKLTQSEISASAFGLDPSKPMGRFMDWMNLLTQPLTVPGRMLNAVDEFGVSLNMMARSNQVIVKNAYLETLDRGFKEGTPEFMKNFDEVLEKGAALLTTRDHNEITNFAAYIASKDPLNPESWMGGLLKLANHDSIFVKVIMTETTPFRGIPTHLFMDAMSSNSLTNKIPMFKNYRNYQQSITGMSDDIVKYQNMIGTALLGTGLAYGYFWSRTRARASDFEFKGKDGKIHKIGLGGLDALSTVFSLGAGMGKWLAIRKALFGQEDDRETYEKYLAAGKAWVTIMREIVEDKTMLKGVAGLLNAVQGRTSAPLIVGEYMSTLVPSGWAGLQKAWNNPAHKARIRMIDSFLNKINSANEALADVHDVFTGRLLKEAKGTDWFNYFSPIPHSTDVETPLSIELDALNFNRWTINKALEQLTASVAGHRVSVLVSAKSFAKATATFGKLMHEEGTKVLNRKEYQEGTYQYKRLEMEMVMQKIFQAVRKQQMADPQNAAEMNKRKVRFVEALGVEVEEEKKKVTLEEEEADTHFYRF